MDANLLAELVALTAGHGSKKHRRVGFESDKIVVTILGADGDNSFGPPMAQRSGTKLQKSGQVTTKILPKDVQGNENTTKGAPNQTK